MAAAPKTNQIPMQDKIIDSVSGFVSRTWLEFFRAVKANLDPLGVERSHPLINAKTTIVGDGTDNIEGMVFDKERISFAAVDYLIQRVTDSNELVSGGIFIIFYKPSSNAWEFLVAPNTAGITLSVTAGGVGQVQYVSTNQAGTPEISRIVWRASTLAAKHSTYSLAGA